MRNPQSFVDRQELKYPRWTTRPDIKKFVTAFSEAKDNLAELFTQGLFARLIELCPNDALDALGRNFNLKRAYKEPDEKFREYLKNPFERWSKAGTREGLIGELAHIGYPNAKIVPWGDLIDDGVPTAFGGGYKVIPGKTLEGDIGYLGKVDGITVIHVSQPFQEFRIQVNDKSVVIYFATNAKAEVLSVARDVVDAVNRDEHSSPLVGSKFFNTGNGVPQQGQISLSVPENDFFYVRLPAPNGFLPTAHWDDAQDFYYDYPTGLTSGWKRIPFGLTGVSDAFFRVFSLGPNDVWFLDTLGADIFHYDGTNFQQATLPLTVWLYGLYGAASNSIWAVGAGGTVLHYDGITWNQVAVPTTKMLRDIWVFAPNDIWVVGYSGFLMHYDGTSWTVVSTPPTTANLWKMFGFAPNNIWAVGEKGTLIHYDGIKWEKVTVPTTQDLMSVWASGPDDLWVGGWVGTLLQYKGGVWKSYATGHTYPIRSIHGFAPNDIWACASDQFILHYDGIKWESTYPTGKGAWNSIHGSSPSDVWCVAYGGNALTYASVKTSIPIYQGSTGKLWDTDVTWDLIPPYPGAIDDIRHCIWQWKPAHTSCRFVSIQIGTLWIPVPIGDLWSSDGRGNFFDFYSFHFAE